MNEPPGPADQFIRVLYECKVCRTKGQTFADKDCSPEWMEKLHAILVCDGCSDDLKILDDSRVKISRFTQQLEINRTKLSADQEAELRLYIRSCEARRKEASQRIQERRKSKPTEPHERRATPMLGEKEAGLVPGPGHSQADHCDAAQEAGPDEDGPDSWNLPAAGYAGRIPDHSEDLQGNESSLQL